MAHRAMRRNPTAPEPHRSIAGCLARAGSEALAKQEYRLAFLLGDATALEEAFSYFRAPGELLEIAPDTPVGLMTAAQLLRDRPAEATEASRRAWEGFGDVRALAGLTDATGRAGAPAEALELRTAASEGCTAAGQQRSHSRPELLEDLGRNREAVAELELGAERLPGRVEVLAPLGHRYLAARRFSQARGAFEAIVAKEGPALARKHLLVARGCSRRKGASGRRSGSRESPGKSSPVT